MFLDYGDLWEDTWNEHTEAWRAKDRSSLKDYVSATEFNKRHEKDPVLTQDEQYLDPYPENLSTRCHWKVGETKKHFEGNVSEFSDWYAWDGDNAGIDCKIIWRNPNNESYWVKGETNPNNLSYKVVSGVPREAIKFADIPYSKCHKQHTHGDGSDASLSNWFETNLMLTA